MYEKYYRFTGSPFRLTPDHRFFFRSSVHKKALSYLQYGLQQGEGFIVITGKVGTGKSTLVSQLLADLDTKQFVAAPINTTQIGAAGKFVSASSSSVGLSETFDRLLAIGYLGFDVPASYRALRACQTSAPADPRAAPSRWRPQ